MSASPSESARLHKTWRSTWYGKARCEQSPRVAPHDASGLLPFTHSSPVKPTHVGAAHGMPGRSMSATGPAPEARNRLFSRVV